MENIFSLLFLRYEDIHEETSSESGAEDYDESRLNKSDSSLKMSQVASSDNLQDTSSASTINNFQQEGDVSSLLRTLPLIPAHVSGSPPQDIIVGEDETADMLLNSPQTESNAIDISGTPKEMAERSSGSFSGVTFASSPSCNLNSPDVQNESKSPAGTVSEKSNTLQESRERKKSNRSNYSELSVPSNVTIRASHQGFVCNQNLVLNVLQCLKDCLLETNSAIYSTLSKDSSVHKTTSVLSSVNPESMQENMKR